MSNVEAEAESRIIHAARNLDQHLRTRLHHVFHREKQIVRRVGQKLFPEANRLLDVPLREVDIRDKPAVDDDPPHAEPRGQRRRLPEAGHRVGAHVRVDGAGDRLGKRRMQPERANFLTFRLHAGKRRRILQHRRIAERSDLISAVIFLRQPGCAGSHARNMDLIGTLRGRHEKSLLHAASGQESISSVSYKKSDRSVQKENFTLLRNLI